MAVLTFRENVDTMLDLCPVDAKDTVINFWKSDVPFSDGHDIMTLTKTSLKKPSPQDFSFRDSKSGDTQVLKGLSRRRTCCVYICVFAVLFIYIYLCVCSRSLKYGYTKSTARHRHTARHVPLLDRP